MSAASQPIRNQRRAGPSGIAPGVALELIPIVEGSEALEHCEIDLAITPARLLALGHPFERLFEDEFTCLVWSANAQAGSSIPLKTYLRLGHVVVRVVPQLLIGTSRIATLHLRLATFYARYLPLKLVAPPVEIPRLEEHMQWYKSRDHDPGTVWLRSLLKSALGGSAIEKGGRTGRVRRKSWTVKSPLS